MERITKDLIKQLLATDLTPSLSLYMPTHRSHPKNQQDPILFRNLVKQLEESLLLKYSSADARKFLGPLESLSDDKVFWNHTSEGLAVFCGTGFLFSLAMVLRFTEFLKRVNRFSFCKV